MLQAAARGLQGLPLTQMPRQLHGASAVTTLGVAAVGQRATANQVPHRLSVSAGDCAHHLPGSFQHNCKFTRLSLQRTFCLPHGSCFGVL
jgi:hypothetical protein